jgi:predicted DNA-binding protein (UPF0251 family)
VRLYTEEWLSMAQIAARLPVARQTVRNVLARRGVRARPRSWGNRNRNMPQSEVAKVVEACVGRGLKAREAAAELGIGEAAVWYRLRQAGVRLRDVRRVR